MANDRKLNVRLARDAALTVTRVSIKYDKLCYVIVADKWLQYKSGRSKIVYIGTTKKGVGRVAQSAAGKAATVLRIPGVRSFTARVVTCRGRQRVQSWRALERALILVFKDMYGEVPRCNSHGKRMKVRDEFEYFAKSRLKRILEEID